MGRRGGKLGFTRQPTKFWCSSSVTWWGSGPAVRVLLVPEIGMIAVIVLLVGECFLSMRLP